MLHNTLSKLLVSVASRYAELSPSDVGIGIGGGRLVIDNVKLRAHTFNSPALPFHVHQGRAGRLRVNVPWSALSSAPVEVYLENVHLIAAPKQTATAPPTSPPAPPPPSPATAVSTKEPAAERKGEWHQTIVGRLAFNVSVELYGLKIEYRDDTCVGIISVASLHAFSTGRDWQSRFVSLAADRDQDPTDPGTAVAMRKLVKLAGVHWVMIPRRVNGERRDKNHEPGPQLDLESFESRAPIVDGIGVTVRVLLCTGTAQTHAEPNRMTSGLHTEIDVDLEQPDINLTARQIKWIDHIVKQGFGLRGKGDVVPVNAEVDAVLNSSPPTKRRPRYVTPADVHAHSQHHGSINGRPYNALSTDASHVPDDAASNKGDPRARPQRSETDSLYSSQNPNGIAQESYRDEEVGPEIEEVSDYEDEADGESEGEQEMQHVKPPKGGLFSIWRAIVSENGDESVDDAAVALGLSARDESFDEKDGSIGEAEEDALDFLYARSAVSAAAEAGGLTMKLRVKTPDMAAWDLVESLRKELEHEREAHQKLQNLETVLEEAEQRVRDSETQVETLLERNRALARELQDLERLTSQAGKNKDAMIRQIEAAHSKAERNLQAMYQAKFEQRKESGEADLGAADNQEKLGVDHRRDVTEGITIESGEETEGSEELRAQTDSESFSTDFSTEDGGDEERITGDADNAEDRDATPLSGISEQRGPSQRVSLNDSTKEEAVVDDVERVNENSVTTTTTREGPIAKGGYSGRAESAQPVDGTPTLADVELRGGEKVRNYDGRMVGEDLEDAVTFEGLTLI